MKIYWNTFIKKRTPIKDGFPTGTVLFTGGQGAGKSLSATNYIALLKEKYPDMIIISNIKLNGADKVIAADQIPDYVLADYGMRPVAFFVDEIQTVLFNSKKSMSFEMFRAICQQRKTRKTIIGTLQEFLDLDITYRRQLAAVVQCSRFGHVQIEKWKDPETLKYDPDKGDYTARVINTKIWKRHDKAFKRYDTYEVVNAVLDVDENKRILSSNRNKPQAMSVLNNK